VITNFHVVEGETQLTVTHLPQGGWCVPQREDRGCPHHRASIPFFDLALLKFEPPEDLDHHGACILAEDRPVTRRAIRCSRSVIRSGLERTVSRGIVSKKNRAEQGLDLRPDDDADQSGQQRAVRCSTSAAKSSA
jgi:S1-C subfamily serine protease